MVCFTVSSPRFYLEGLPCPIDVEPIKGRLVRTKHLNLMFGSGYFSRFGRACDTSAFPPRPDIQAPMSVFRADFVRSSPRSRHPYGVAKGPFLTRLGHFGVQLASRHEPKSSDPGTVPGSKNEGRRHHCTNGPLAIMFSSHSVSQIHLYPANSISSVYGLTPRIEAGCPGSFRSLPVLITFFPSTLRIEMSLSVKFPM